MLNLSHKNLEVYKMAMILVKEVYKMTKTFPKEELFVLVSQLRRASISVCSNIAEGASRVSKKEKKRFYEISRSSLVEIDTQVEIGIILHYYRNEQMKELHEYIESIFRMLSKMILNLKMSAEPDKPTRH